MTCTFDTRRYLTRFDSTRAGNILTDVLVIGSGVAGARAAVEAAKYGQVILLSKGEFHDSATNIAQGGVAVALDSQDSPKIHADDTLRVGCGLNDPAAVERLTTEAARRIEELMSWGASLDREENHLALGKEGGHSRRRIVHARGDQTGREISLTMQRRVKATAGLRNYEHCFLIDLLTLDDVCVGAVAYHPRHGHQLIWAKQTILSTGGCGQLWRETTNPPGTTGDGIAAAFRAGAELRDVEFMQFHPTTLYVAGSGRALISEAVRGEGALLVDREGNRFMRNYHPDAELAPRDVVSRAIHHHLSTRREPCVYLDARHLRGFSERFPHIDGLCAGFKINVKRDLIPVRPSAHYLVGGVRASLEGRTSLEGLLCCGEAASTGVHGANRMASNSLLEGLVFGQSCGQEAGMRAAADPNPAAVRRIRHDLEDSARTGLDLPDVLHSLRSLMWRNAGIVRHGQRLNETIDILNFWGHYTMDKTFDDTAGWELQNQLTLARLIAIAAGERDESRGVHWREDAPQPSAGTPYHVLIRRDPTGTVARRESRGGAGAEC